MNENETEQRLNHGRVSENRRFPISRKMLLGYLPLSLFMVLISGFVLSSLNRFSQANEAIIRRDIPMLEASDKMTDALLSQELYRRRYMILRSPDMLRLFWQKGEEFAEHARKADTIRAGKDFPISSILSLHEQYENLFVESARPVPGEDQATQRDWEPEISRIHKSILARIEEVAHTIHREQNRQLFTMSEDASEAFRLTAGLSLLAILVGIGASGLVTRNIAGSIRSLQRTAAQIAAGNFDVKPATLSQDELGDLAADFGEMAGRLKRLEEMYRDANPLTRLPGNVAIENVLTKRLRAETPTAFCLVDLDEFKAFNDRYGYARGSEVIKEVARILTEVAKRHGTADDFIGHIGGDDFVIITCPERYEVLCIQLIAAFESRISDFYDEEDRAQGHIVSRTRQGVVMSFPIMTMSIAVVTNRDGRVTNHIETGEVAAEIKEYAKRLPGSNYVVDRRSEHRVEDDNGENVVVLRRRTGDTGT